MSLDRTLETTATFVTRFSQDLGHIAPVLVVLVLLIVTRRLTIVPYVSAVEYFVKQLLSSFERV